MKYNISNLETVRRQLELLVNQAYAGKPLADYTGEIVADYLKKINWITRLPKFFVTVVPDTENKLINKIQVGVWNKDNLLDWINYLVGSKESAQTIWSKTMQGVFGFIGDIEIEEAIGYLAHKLQVRMDEQKNISDLDDNGLIALQE